MIITGWVGSGARDFDETSSTNTTLKAEYHDLLGTDIEAYALLDTSSIGANNIITAATIHWYNESYTKSRNATYHGYVSIPIDQGSPDRKVYEFTTQPTLGWNQHDLTGVELDYINKTGDTTIHFGVNPVSNQYYRTWLIRAYEYSPTGAFQIYLEVHYEEPASRRFRYFLM
jgi:hypothetical protein